MRLHDTWGGHQELVALARMTGKNVVTLLNCWQLDNFKLPDFVCLAVRRDLSADGGWSTTPVFYTQPATVLSLGGLRVGRGFQIPPGD